MNIGQVKEQRVSLTIGPFIDVQLLEAWDWLVAERLRLTIEAAEARKEGMEEGYRAGFMHAAAEPDRHLENSLYEWLREQRK